MTSILLKGIELCYLSQILIHFSFFRDTQPIWQQEIQHLQRRWNWFRDPIRLRIHVWIPIYWYLLCKYCLNVSTTPITAMGCRQCLPLSVVHLKSKHCRIPHCRNGVVDTFGHSHPTHFGKNWMHGWIGQKDQQDLKWKSFGAIVQVASKWHCHFCK